MNTPLMRYRFPYVNADICKLALSALSKQVNYGQSQNLVVYLISNNYIYRPGTL